MEKRSMEAAAWDSWLKDTEQGEWDTVQEDDSRQDEQRR